MPRATQSKGGETVSAPEAGVMSAPMAIGEYGARLIMAYPIEVTAALAVFVFGCMGYAAVRLSGK